MPPKKTPAYSDTTVAAGQSKAEIDALFEKYNIHEHGLLTVGPGRFEVHFRRDGIPVRLPFTVDGIFQAMLKSDPWTTRRRCTKEEHEEKILEQANKAVWRHAAHYLKAVFEAIEFGIITFEEAMLHAIVMPGGRRVYDDIGPRVSDIVRDGLPSLPPAKR